MRFCTIGGLVALLTVTAAAAQNLPAPMSTDRVMPTAPAKPSRAAKRASTPKAPSVVTVTLSRLYPDGYGSNPGRRSRTGRSASVSALTFTTDRPARTCR